MDDLIRRQDVFDLIDNWDGLMIPKGVFRCNVEDFPPVQPEKKKGKWIFDDNDHLTHCSSCGQGKWMGYIPTPEEATKWMPICPKCGAYMRGEKHESD